MRRLAIVLAGCTAPHAPAQVDVRALLDVPENIGGALSPDGTRLLFRSDRDGVPELYLAEVGKPDAPAVKLVAGPERVASAVFSRDGRAVIFRRDTGADENFHILRKPLDGPEIDLTPDEPLWRDSPLVFDGMIIYGARKSSDYKSMIVVQDLTGGAPRVVYRDSGAGTVLDVLPDASHALWFREAATGGHELLEVDLATGGARPISDPSPQMLTAGAYSADGARIYVATDHGSERHVVEVLDRPSLRVLDLMTLLTAHTAKRYLEELGDPVADATLIEELSPIHAVDRVRAPLFVYQGKNDARVPRVHADTIVSALRRRGIHVDYMLAADEGHTVARRANEVELLGRMLRFLADATRR